MRPTSSSNQAGVHQLPDQDLQDRPDDPAALVTLESFQSLAKPGDRLRLLGDNITFGTDTGKAEKGFVLPAASGIPLVSVSEVAAWGSSIAAGDGHSPRTAPRAAHADVIGLSVEADAHSGEQGSVLWDGSKVDGDVQMAWGPKLEAASSQAEKLAVLAEVRPSITRRSTVELVWCAIVSYSFITVMNCVGHSQYSVWM